MIPDDPWALLDALADDCRALAELAEDEAAASEVRTAEAPPVAA